MALIIHPYPLKSRTVLYLPEEHVVMDMALMQVNNKGDMVSPIILILHTDDTTVKKIRKVFFCITANQALKEPISVKYISAMSAPDGSPIHLFELTSLIEPEGNLSDVNLIIQKGV